MHQPRRQIIFVTIATYYCDDDIYNSFCVATPTLTMRRNLFRDESVDFLLSYRRKSSMQTIMGTNEKVGVVDEFLNAGKMVGWKDRYMDWWLGW